MVRLLRLLSVAALVAATAAPAAATDIEGISFAPRADGPGVLVRIHTNGPVERYAVEPERGRLAVTLYGAHASDRLRQEPAAPPVRSYAVGGRDADVTILLDLSESAEVVAYRDSRSDDLLLAVTPVAPSAPMAWGGAPAGREPEPRPDVRPSPEVAPPVRPRPRRDRRPSPEAAPPSAPAPSPAAPAPAASAEGEPSAWRLDTIILDAGHGAHDIGATYHGVREKDVTLGITRRLGRMIEQELPGVRVVYTRSGDQFHELRERGRIANRAGGKLFISIHANAASASSARGTETYFLAPHRSESAAEVMDRENSVIALESDPSHYEEYTGAEGDILRAMAMSAYQEESQALAGLIEGEFVRSGRHSRGVKQAGFLVLWAASMPAVLVETGFVSNPEEGAFLASEDGQEQTARSIFRAVAAYREQYERGTRLVSAE